MAMVLDAFVGGALSKLSALLQERASMMLGVGDELKKLLRKLESLKKFLVDAESKAIQDESIRSWLGELKDFTYDADDVIDLCRIEGTKLLEGDQPFTSTHSVYGTVLIFMGMTEAIISGALLVKYEAHEILPL